MHRIYGPRFDSSPPMAYNFHSYGLKFFSQRPKAKGWKIYGYIRLPRGKISRSALDGCLGCMFITYQLYLTHL